MEEAREGTGEGAATGAEIGGAAGRGNGFKITCGSGTNNGFGACSFGSGIKGGLGGATGAGLTTTDGEETITGSGAEATTVVETLAFFAGCFVPGGGAIFAGFACVFFEARAAGIGAID